MFSLESPQRGNSNEYKQYTIFNMKEKNSLNYPKSANMGCFQETQARVRNSRSKLVISVRATEILLYLYTCLIIYLSVFVRHCFSITCIIIPAANCICGGGGILF